MEQPEKATDSKDTASTEASAEPAPAPSTDKKSERPAAAAELDPYWWAPWAVLVGLVLYGLLGFLGVLFPGRKGPTAADVPTTPAPSASAVDKRLAPAPPH